MTNEQPTGAIIQDQSECNVLFVHSKIDDACLSPFAFRVYCHISRRANKNGSAWPGNASMAKVCRMSVSMVKRAVKELEARNILQVKRSAGGRETNTYFLTAPSKWNEKFLKNDECIADDDDDTRLQSNPVMQEPAASPDITTSQLPESHKGTPLSNSIEGNPNGELFSLGDADAVPDIEKKISAIYKAYPRHKMPDAAKRAIRAALKKVDAETLLNRTVAYASLVKRKGTEKDFIPYPATWFNGGGYNDNELLNNDDSNRKRLW